MNTRSSTKVEVVATDEIVSPMIWTQLFLEVQGYPIKENILYQDNKSTMLLKTNGCKSAGKCSHHLNIQYFYSTNQKAKGHSDIKYCPTDEMIGDYMTKPLHRSKFDGFHQQKMHLPVAAQLIMAAVLHSHDIVSKSCISHNCFFIIVFLYSQKFFGQQLHIITVLSFILQHGRSRFTIMGETGYGS